MRLTLFIGSAVLALAAPSLAQPVDLPIAPATTTHYPPGVKVIKAASGQVYADARGRTLYGMDLRTLLRWNPDPAKYCQAECLKDWEPLLAPAGAKANIMFPRGFGESRTRPGTRLPPVDEGFINPQAAPDWTIIDGPSGPQWVYKGWHMVFIRKGEKRGGTGFDGAESLTWNTLKFVPPIPQIVAPEQVSPLFAAGAYALADKDGHMLFTGTCAATCDWRPLRGGLASRGIGEWAVGSTGDAPQWLYRGKPVFVARDEGLAAVPAGAIVLRP